MPRKHYFDQRRFNQGWSQNKSRNRYRWGIANYARRGNQRYSTGGPFAPKLIEGTWFVVRNLTKRSLIHNGKKAR